MKILITGAWQQAKEHMADIEAMGHEVIFLQQEKDDLPCPEAEIDGVVCNALLLYHPIEKFTSLRYIQLTSAGFDRVPIEYIRQKKIALYNAAGVYSIPMAEYALAGILQIYKNMAAFRDNQKRHIWEKRRSLSELYGKKVLIIGCGNVGRECALRFSAFGCTVTGLTFHDEKTKQMPNGFTQVESIAHLDDVLNKYDIIVVACQLTDMTRHLLDDRCLEKAKAGSVLINVSRGELVDTEALIKQLNSGRLAGAVLDVFESEPLPERSPLWDMENVIITPHNSYVGDGNAVRLWNVIKSNLEKERA